MRRIVDAVEVDRDQQVGLRGVGRVNAGLEVVGQVDLVVVVQVAGGVHLGVGRAADRPRRCRPSRSSDGQPGRDLQVQVLLDQRHAVLEACSWRRSPCRRARDRRRRSPLPGLRPASERRRRSWSGSAAGWRALASATADGRRARGPGWLRGGVRDRDAARRLANRGALAGARRTSPRNASVRSEAGRSPGPLSQPGRDRVDLAVERALLGLRGQVRRQVAQRQDRLQVVGQQRALGALAGRRRSA